MVLKLKKKKVVPQEEKNQEVKEVKDLKTVVNKSTLLDVLKKVKPGIASKDIIESMTYFFFSGEDIITYNDHISIQHPFKTNFSFFVKAKDFFSIVSKISVQEITLMEEQDKLVLKCQSVLAKLCTIKDDEVISRISTVKDSLVDTEWKSIPENFLECISLCSFAAAKGESDLTLTCIKVNGDYCVASDNQRVAFAKLTTPMDFFFLKSSEVNNLTAINPIKYSVEDSWIHFQNADSCIFSIRKVMGEFPDFFPFLNFDGASINVPKEITEGVDLASVFSDPETPSITLLIQKGVCMITVESPHGELKFKTKIDYSGDDIKFKINPLFLREMLSHSTEITISETRAKLETASFSLLTALVVESE